MKDGSGVGSCVVRLTLHEPGGAQVGGQVSSRSAFALQEVKGRTDWITKSTNLCFIISSTFLFVIRNEMSYPLSGTLRRTTNASARIARNRVNLWHRIRSVSSACLIRIERRTELMLGSIRTDSEGLREMRSGVRSASGVDLVGVGEGEGRPEVGGWLGYEVVQLSE